MLKVICLLCLLQVSCFAQLECDSYAKQHTSCMQNSTTGLLFQAANQDNDNVLLLTDQHQNDHDPAVLYYNNSSLEQLKQTETSAGPENETVYLNTSSAQNTLSQHIDENKFFILEPFTEPDQIESQVQQSLDRKSSSKLELPNTRKIYKKISEKSSSNGTQTIYVSGPFDTEQDNILNGIVLPNGNVQSPYSNYQVDTMQSGHGPNQIVQDPDTGKQFRIPGFQHW